jgi:hypothetical protein
MNCIRLGTDNSITVHEWPDDNRYRTIHPFLTELIGNDCDLVEQVRPIRLYTDHGGPVKQADSLLYKGMASMLIDECGRLKDNEVNVIASWLYGTDLHGSVIVGNVIFCGECFDDESLGLDFCGLEPDVEEKILEMLKRYAKKIERSAE